MAMVTIRDESTTGGPGAREWGLELLTERITVRELIRSRVHQEVKDHNAKAGETFHGLVRPTDSEAGPGGWRVKHGTKIDWKAQFEKAIEAFQKSRVLVLVGDRQVTDLDESVVIGPATRVTFLRLLPLVGG
jgi:hypothetical protein